MTLVHPGRLLYNRAMPHATKSALHDAREGFLVGLASRGEALRPVVYRFVADPTGRVVRAELQRRLHSLLASAQLFEVTELVSQLQSLTARLDEVGLGGGLWQPSDSDRLLALVHSLCPGETVITTSDAAGGASASISGFACYDPAAHARSTSRQGAVMLMRVLLVCSRPHAASLRAVLEDAPIELLHAADPEQALQLLEGSGPSCALIAAEFAMLPDIDLVRRLRVDPRHPVHGVFLMLPQGASYDADYLRQTGADGVLIEPISWELLGPLLEQAERTASSAPPPEPSNDQLSELDGDEPSSLIESLVPRRSAELSAATLSTIARVRAQLAEHASNETSPSESSRVRARPVSSFAVQPATAGSLAGRRVLVVDDDPAMLWFFSGLLREAGAEVLQARDGAEAFDLARRKRPQLVLSDILMPKLDGFALRRAMQQDLSLEHVPVLLLSWKGDLVQDGQQLAADAELLVRKEASVSELLEAIERALSPRRRIEQALLDQGEVSGLVEEIGIVALIECVAAARPNARLTVEDEADLYELDIADATDAAVTRTAANGSFMRAGRACVQLLGVSSGSFHVRSRSGAVRNPMPAPLASALSAAVSELSTVIAAVSDASLDRVARVSFDDKVLSCSCSADLATQELVARLRGLEMSPERLVREGVIGRDELETRLRKLARQGAISGLWTSDGDDLLAGAWRLDERGLDAQREPTAPPPTPARPPALPARDSPSPVAVESLAPQPRDEHSSSTAAEREPDPANETPSESVGASASLQQAPLTTSHVDEPSFATEDAPRREQASPGSGVSRTLPQIDEDEDGEALEFLAPEHAVLIADEDESESRAASASSGADFGAPAQRAPAASPAQARYREVGRVETSAEAVDARREAATSADVDSMASARGPESSFDLRSFETPAADPAIAQRRRREGIQLVATLAASAALGYIGALQFERYPAAFHGSEQASGAPALEPQLTAAVVGRETSIRSGLDPAAGLGTVLPYIDTTRGVPVGSDEGLVVFEYMGEAPGPSLEIDGRALGFPPLAVALAANPHQLKLRFAGDAILRTLTVRAGETRVITLPLSKP